MATINGKACVINGVPVDKVFSNGRQVYCRNMPVDTDVPNNAIYKNKYGYVLRDVVWYDADKKVYVATDSNGQAISGSGKKISATGRNNEIKIRRHKNGHIDLSVDLSDAEVTNFIHTVNQHQVGDTVSFIQVTDSHYDPFGVIYEQDVPQALPGIGEQNYKMTNAIYNQFIGREGHKDMFKNIGAIAQRFSRKPAFTMHTGDIVDGSPNDPQERLKSFDIVFSYMDSGLNMPNYVTMGNHDLLRGEPEQGYLTSAQRQLPNRALINQKLMSHVRAQGGADIASVDHGYYSVDDNVNKIRYIMLNTHDNQNTTPGQANTQGAITKAQIDWLIQKLKATPDDFHVVFFGHHVLPPAKFVRNGNPNDYTWWIYNLNGDVVADILNAFQHSTSVSVATKQDYVWRPADFVGSWQVDFSAHKPGRVIEMATGHRHNNQQWSAEQTIYGINTVVEENLAGEWWDNFGTNHSFQFAVHTINLSTGELFIDRFSPTNLVANQFTKYNFQI